MPRKLAAVAALVFLASSTGCWQQFRPDDTTGGDDDATGFDDDDTTAGDDDSGNDDDDATEAPLCPDDNFEDNDTSATATAVTATTYAALRICDEDLDYYAFDATAGQEVTIRLTFLQDEGDIDVSLIGPDGVILSLGNTVSDNEDIGPEPVEQTGTYILEVELYGDLGAAPGNDYTLEITLGEGSGDDDDTIPEDDDDATPDDDDSTPSCEGPAVIQPTVTLTNASGPGATEMSMDDPITISVQLDHISGTEWSQLYQGAAPGDPCLYRILVIDPAFPGDNQIFWSCGASFNTVTLSCTYPTSPVDTYLLEPYGYTYPLASRTYTIEVDLDPSCYHEVDPTCSVTGLPVLQYSVTVREGAKTDAVADSDPIMGGIGECEDAIDNDGDALTDCNDPDCAGKDGCP